MIDVLDTPENRSPTARFCTVIGNSMSGVLKDGWTVRIETGREPADGDVVAVHIHGEGRLVGYWKGGDHPMLEKENPAFEPVDLTAKGAWEVVGVVEAIVSAPVPPRHS